MRNIKNLMIIGEILLVESATCGAGRQEAARIPAAKARGARIGNTHPETSAERPRLKGEVQMATIQIGEDTVLVDDDIAGIAEITGLRVFTQTRGYKGVRGMSILLLKRSVLFPL
jgi:hypothetical protein